jgi:hypothetical protein
VEGETDEFIFQEAARIQDCDLFSAGVSCFKFTELTVSHFIKLADQLGIDWKDGNSWGSGRSDLHQGDNRDGHRAREGGRVMLDFHLSTKPSFKRSTGTTGLFSF